MFSVPRSVDRRESIRENLRHSAYKHIADR